MANEEFYKRLDKCMEIGGPILDELLKIDDPVVFKTIISACIDCWSVNKGYDVRDVVDEIFDGVHDLNEEEEEV
jgi:hypothetical protein